MGDKHTPGPWHVANEGFARKGLWSAPTVYATDDDLRYVAVCACADELNFHSATDNLANAHLIAAAPDMLAALRVARDCVIESFDYAEDADDLLMAEARLRDVDMAISKAEGKSNASIMAEQQK
jgi:hypothetical protein